MPDVMALIDMKPLNYPTKFGIDPKTTGGRAAADLMFTVPMLADPAGGRCGHFGQGGGQRIRRHAGRQNRLTDGNVTFDIDNDRLRQTGK
jgi:hypothetical protein